MFSTRFLSRHLALIYLIMVHSTLSFAGTGVDLNKIEDPCGFSLFYSHPLSMSLNEIRVPTDWAYSFMEIDQGIANAFVYWLRAQRNITIEKSEANVWGTPGRTDEFLSELLQTLELNQQRMLSYLKRQRAEVVAAKDRASLTIAGEKYKVIGKLSRVGSNSEADVYLCNSPQGEEVVVKLFLKQDDFETHKRFYAETEAVASDMIRPFLISDSERAMVFRYEPGIVFDDLLKIDRYVGAFPGAFVILQKQAAARLIRTLGRGVISNRDSKASRLIDPHQNNLLYSPEKRRFFLIDPF